MEKPTEEDFKKAVLGTSEEPKEKVEEVTTTKVGEKTETTEEPFKAELERLKSKKTPQQKARDSLYYNAKQAKELGIDISNDEKLKEIFGIDTKKDVPPETPEVVETEEDKPITRKELEELLKQQQTAKTVDSLVLDIKDDLERELVQYHLQNTIKLSGDAEEDVRLARTLANSVRDKQIESIQSIAGQTQTHSTASGAPSKIEQPFAYTAEEQQFLATGLVTHDDILKARKAQGK